MQTYKLISTLQSHANNHAPSAIVLSQASSGTWQQMLASLEAINRLRHPNVGEAYIKWRSQDMLVKRLWEDVKFPGVDPDPVYVSAFYMISCGNRIRLIYDRHKSAEDTAPLSRS